MKVSLHTAFLLTFIVKSSVATQQLTSKNFKSTIESGKNGMVKFFQPWCGHCTRMKPAWDELADKAHPSVFIADVDCSKESELCAENDVKGYPTIYYYTNGGRTRESYSGGRDIVDLESFVNDKLAVKCNPKASNIAEICSEKAQKYVSKWKDKEEEEIRKEVARLEKMLNQSMKPELMAWVQERFSILNQIVAPSPSVISNMMEKALDMSSMIYESIYFVRRSVYGGKESEL